MMPRDEGVAFELKSVTVWLMIFAAGYFYGFSDAKNHQHSIETLTVQRIGGSNRDNFKNDLDKQTDAVAGNQRRYLRSVLRRLAFIRAARIVADVLEGRVEGVRPLLM